MGKLLKNPFQKLNSNVRLIFIFTILQSLGRGIWQGSVLSAFIFYIAGESTTWLGFTSAASGITMTLVVFPAGFMADKFRRDKLLKFAGIFGLISSAFMIFAQDLLLIFIALAFWGLFQGFNRPANESLLADSIQSGQRSEIYSRLQFYRQIANSVGPFLNILFFFVLGNVWEINILKTVMIFGIIISTSSIFPLFLMNDDKGVEQSESIYSDRENGENGKSLKRSVKLIPIVILSSNLLVGSAAGMTIKFFPIFFIEIYSMDPMTVNFILGVTSVFTGLSSVIAQKLSRRNGRVQMMIIGQLLATFFLFLISTYPTILVLGVLFVLRGALMNASQPLSRSILMDVIPRRHRGKINSIEALAWGLFWNASAALGGVLIDKYDYSVTFRITATVYLIATLPLALIIPLVKKETV